MTASIISHNHLRDTRHCPCEADQVEELPRSRGVTEGMEARVSSRHEIAERLRARYLERNAPARFEAQDVGMQAYDYLHDLIDCLPDGESAFTVIADLIDPKTCQMVECTIDHGSRSWGMRCTACGEEFEHMDVGSRPFDYCPRCGARVVPDGQG